MKENATHNINHYRIKRGPFGSGPEGGSNGCFEIPYGRRSLRIMASDGSGWDEDVLPGEPWEHVSVSLPDRCPTWEEMDYVKKIFWDDAETVIQFHVPTSDHVNQHNFCLHLWKPKVSTIPRPPAVCVGVA